MEKSTNHQIFIELYTSIHSQLSRFCRAIAGNQMDAEDLMNGTILATLESMDKLKDPSSFKSYIFSVASNLNKMRFRRDKFHAEYNEREIAFIMDNGTNPEVLTDFTIIYEKMLSLPDKMAETLILFHISDISMEEIQKIQGGSLSGVKLRLKRGREKLINSLNTPKQRAATILFFTL
jgi:RNA polymerase sigma factor (sigma-70 family)